MTQAITILAEHLQHPEGPDVLENGDIVFVETWTGKIKAFRQGRGAIDYAVAHGGPNACAVGSDGCVYVTQMGERWRDWRADRPATPGIQRIHPDGRVETVVDSVDGIACKAPNDLCFGADGRLYFTDPAGWPGMPDHPPAHVFAVGSDGRGEVIAELRQAFPNGIVADRSSGIVWCETQTRLVKRHRPGAEIEVIAQLPEGHMADGLKFDDHGRLWIATVYGGGFDVIDPETGAMEFVPCPNYPLNCVFVGDTLIVTDRGARDVDTARPAREGRLLAFQAGVSGPALFRGRL